MDKQINELLEVLKEYQELGISEQIDYQKFYLYSIITHSTAIEGSTVTEIENQLLFDEGITAKGKPMVEQLMNLDLKRAYEQSIRWAREHKPFTVEMLKNLSALVMRNTGSHYSTLMGEFDSSKGDLRLVGVTAGAGGRSYMGLPQSSDETGRTLQPHQPAERSAHQKSQRHRCLPAKFRCPQHSRYYSPMGGWQRQNVAPHHESPTV